MGVGWKGEVKQPHVVNLRSHITAILEGSGTSLSMMKQPQLPCKPAEEPRKRQDRHCGGLVEGNAEWLRKRPLPVRRGSVALATGLRRRYKRRPVSRHATRRNSPLAWSEAVIISRLQVVC